MEPAARPPQFEIVQRGKGRMPYWAWPVLTQSLNRGAISQGQMRFDVEGVQDGRLTTVKWDELQQTPGAPGQEYAFRYFQRLTGSLVLPAGFTPQRVKVALRGKGANVDAALAWTTPSSPGEN